MKKRNTDKDSIIASIRNHILNSNSKFEGNLDGIYQGSALSREVAILRGELDIAHLEVALQNNELYLSAMLLESERAKFEQLFNFAPISYFILDRSGIIEDLNQIGAELLGLSKTNLLNTPFQKFIVSEDLEQFYLFFHSLQLNKTKQSRDLKLALKNGTCYTRIEGIQTKSKYNDEFHYYITVTDVTEIRHAQQNLLATAQRLEMSLRASATGAWSLDLENRKISFDSFCYSLFEIQSSEFDGTLNNFIRLVHPDDREKVWHSLSNSINETSQINLEFRISSKNNKLKILSLKGREAETTNFHKSYVGLLTDITLQHSQVERDQRQQADKQRLIMSAAFEAQEKERQKISAALHDSVCQLLYGVKLNIQNIQETNNLKIDFKNINALIDQAISETRALSYDLTPSVLRDFGFTAGVKEIAQRLSSANFKIKVTIKKDANFLEPNLQLVVFRIMQELLNNSIKHSKASLVEIKFCTEGDVMTLIVMDNGKGFRTSVDQAMTYGSGLRGIKNRIFLFDGTIDIESSASGTIATVKLKKDVSKEPIFK